MSDTANFDLEIMKKSPYYENAFRIIGVPSNITRNEIKTAMQSLRVRAKAGGLHAGDDALPFMVMPERTEASVRDAFNKLENPQTRIRERLFWFSCHTPEDKTAFNLLKNKDLNGAKNIWLSINKPSSIANRAILYHAFSIAKYPFAEKPDSWKKALEKWIEALEKDEFWEQFIDIEMKSEFEPFATVSDIESLKNESIELVLKPSGVFFEQAVNERKLDDAKRHLEIVRSKGIPAHIYSRFESDICEPLEVQFENNLNHIFSKLSDELKNETMPPNIAKNKCDKAYDCYLIEIPNKLKQLDDIFGKQSQAVQRAKEKIANCLRDLSIKYHNNANAFLTSKKILLEAIELIPDSYISEQWKNDDLPILKQHANEEKNRLLLEPIVSLSKELIDQLEFSINSSRTINKKDVCDRAYQRFQTELLPKIMRLSSGSNMHEAREIGVFCLRQISVHYHNDAGLFEISKTILKEASKLSRNNETVAAINQEIEIVNKSIYACQKNLIWFY